MGAVSRISIPGLMRACEVTDSCWAFSVSHELLDLTVHSKDPEMRFYAALTLARCTDVHVVLNESNDAAVQCGLTLGVPVLAEGHVKWLVWYSALKGVSFAERFGMYEAMCRRVDDIPFHLIDLAMHALYEQSEDICSTYWAVRIAEKSIATCHPCVRIFLDDIRTSDEDPRVRHMAHQALSTL